MCIFFVYIRIIIYYFVMEINKNKTDENPNYLGYDEDHNGDWNDFFICQKCKYNYIAIHDTECPRCLEHIKWVD